MYIIYHASSSFTFHAPQAVFQEFGHAEDVPLLLALGPQRDALCLGGRHSRMISWENRGKSMGKSMMNGNLWLTQPS